MVCKKHQWLPALASPMAISSADIGMILAAYGLRLEGGLSVVDLAAGRSDLLGNGSSAGRAATLSKRTNLSTTAVSLNSAPPTTTPNPASAPIPMASVHSQSRLLP